MKVTHPPPPAVGESSFRHETEQTVDPAHAPSPGSFGRVMKRLAAEVDKGERVVRVALRGNPYADDDRGMIALQAGVYRYVEAVELCTKLVDRAAGAVKTTLQSQ